jgi:hypothetical protein
MRRVVWNWVIIVGGYAFAAFLLRLIGGFNAAGDAISKWGRSSSARRLAKSGHSPSSYARSRLGHSRSLAKPSYWRRNDS